MGNRFTRGALAASSLVLAMQFGLVSPALAVTSDVPSVSRGGSVTFSTPSSTTSLAALFVNGEFAYSGPISGWLAPLPWLVLSPCVTVDVTFRVYEEDALNAPFREPLFSEEPSESVEVQFVGDDSVACNDAWGSGGSDDSGDSDEPLAETGSDASAVAGLTGVAGAAALAVAAAVALRTRRAQR